MKTKALIVAFIFVIGLLAYFSVLKIKEDSQQNFNVITWNEYNICFLIPEKFIIEKDATGFKYIGGKNSGHFTLSSGQVNKKFKQTHIGDFKAGYNKTTKLRVFQYQVTPEAVLSDSFVFAKKKPANVIPVRKNCAEYLKRYKVLLEL